MDSRISFVLLAVLLRLFSDSAAMAASYQQRDGTIVDPIQYRDGGGDHFYSGPDLEPGVIASGASLVSAVLGSADLRNASMADASFKEALLTDADFSGALLQRASFFETIADDSTFVGADLRFANMNGRFQGANLVGADLRDTLGEDANFVDANLDSVDMRDAGWELPLLDGATFRSANLSRFRSFAFSAVGADFSNATLTGASIAGGVVSGANFSNANLTAATIGFGFDVEGADFSGALLANMVGLQGSTGAALYDLAADFPCTGFDPAAADWTLVP